MIRASRTLAAVVLAALCQLEIALAANEGWSHDFEAAKKEAAADRKDLLISFTGADRYGLCAKFSEEIFQRDEFKAGVKDQFVLLEIDFPADKSSLSETARMQNAGLKEKFGILSFPTLLLCDAAGRAYALTSYQEGGPVKYLTHLDSLRGKKTRRDEAFDAASKAAGVEQAKLLVAALKELGLSGCATFNLYGDILTRIKTADPRDETGYIKFNTERIALETGLFNLFRGTLGAGEGWGHDFEAARKEASAGDKDLLMDFTGTDWCVWCAKLNKEVFQHAEFKTGVKDKFVLVEVDFPTDKSKLSEATQHQNAGLKEKYGIASYPTILLCDAAGRPYAATQYEKGGPVKYLEHLESLRKNKTRRDEAFAAAARASGVEKARLLATALNQMEISAAAIASCYRDIVAQIQAADPQDETGYFKAAEANE